MEDRRGRLREDDPSRESTHVFYDEFGLEPTAERDEPPERTTTAPADVTTFDLQSERDDDGFSFRPLDDRDEVATVRIEGEAWSLE